jgi:hypothetical protein
VNYANMTKMWSRMPQPNRRNAVWVINQDIEPQLFAMVVTRANRRSPRTSRPAASRQAVRHADGPAGGLHRGRGCGRHGGRHLLRDLKQYFALVKGGGVQTDVSIHLYFDQDTTAFRFILRVGGQPWWPNSITRRSRLPMSAYVALAAR